MVTKRLLSILLTCLVVCACNKQHEGQIPDCNQLSAGLAGNNEEAVIDVIRQFIDDLPGVVDISYSKDDKMVVYGMHD